MHEPHHSDSRRPAELSHVARDGRARMVDVGNKAITRREATAEAWVQLTPEIAGMLRETGEVHKGDVLATARLAGVLAAKKTPELIPLCHSLGLDVADVDAELLGHRVRIVARMACSGRTGVEVEAMTAAAVAALTVYDMVKSAGKGVEIGPVRLLRKKGGKSGSWQREETDGSY